MNSDELQGKWKQMKGSVRQQWGKLTDDDLEMIAGQRDRLIGKLQERYGYLREEAQKKADEWLAAAKATGSQQDQRQAQQKQRMQPPPAGSPTHQGAEHHAQKR